MTAHVYRWRGVDGHGERRQGRQAIRDLAAFTSVKFATGWRELVVCSGNGPVPPPAAGPAGTVAAIERDAQTGKRVWWSEED